ncbi:hypothetical protein GCM10007278_09020 [Paenalcaligenes hominis]|nr:hypothetical protein GCM10007278_09020 [Paenalcaligenes hominis]
MIRKKKHPSIHNKLWGGALWSPSYFAGSCGGATIEIVRQDIEQQQTPSGYEDASASALFISALNGGVFRAV